MSDKQGLVLDRLKQLIDSKQSRQVIATELGCDVSTITKHYNGDRAVTIDYLVKYARYFDVSTDYLLGLAKEPTSDKDFNFVCEVTGLSMHAVQVLNFPVSMGYNETMEFLTSEKIRHLHTDISVGFGSLKSWYKILYLRKKAILEQYNLFVENPSEIGDNLIKVDKAEDRVLLTRYKIEKAFEEMIDIYCKEEIKECREVEEEYREADLELATCKLIWENKENERNADNSETQ